MNRLLTGRYLLPVLVISIVGLFVLSCSQASQLTPAITPISGGPPPVAKTDWETKWEQVVEEAQREGQVVIYGGFSPPVRIALIDAFKQKYGVELDITLGKAVEIAEKLLREDRAGLQVADVLVNGRNALEAALKPAGVLGSFEPLLLLPEVKNPQAWWGGELPWTKDRLIFPSTSGVRPPVIINTNVVKAEELAFMRDVLNPRWVGKIAMEDPTVPGPGLNWFAAFSEILGYDFMKALAKMEPAMTTDKRLLVEWVAKAKYPVGINATPEQVIEFIQFGAPLAFVAAKEGGYTSAGSGVLFYVAKAPHPNATKLFINWLLGKEGQTVFSRASGLPSSRQDVLKDHIPSSQIRQPGANYVIGEGGDFLLTLPEKQKVAKDIFGPLLR
ncbi:MAG: extracellular solute-binding protein [Chloroflexi bacterium]|nr:extracellular solute-binding protein [Chloroflexota bacterium]